MRTYRYAGRVVQLAADGALQLGPPVGRQARRFPALPVEHRDRAAALVARLERPDPPPAGSARPGENISEGRVREALAALKANEEER